MSIPTLADYRMTVEEKIKIYHEVQHYFHVMDAIARVEDYIESNNLTKLQDASFDYGFLADVFEENKDCNVADNDMWRNIISEYIKANF